MAMHASNQSTFAVGGILVNNKTGEVIHEMHNNVLKTLPGGQAFTWDPTAHGERQLGAPRREVSRSRPPRGDGHTGRRATIVISPLW